MLIQDRIQLIIKANNESPSSFADKVGVKRSNLSHVLSGRNNPSLDFLAKVINTYPNVNASWLLTGETRVGEFKAEKQEDNHVKDIGSKMDDQEIEKIVVFYSDKSCSVYKPNAQ